MRGLLAGPRRSQVQGGVRRTVLRLWIREGLKKRDYPYAAIVASFPGAEKADQAGETIWYNEIPTIKTKARFVMEQDLAGVMIWSRDSDAKGELSLLSAIHETLTGPGAGR